MSKYQESIDYLYGLQKHGIKFGLNRTESILERLGNPHSQLKCIHIAGTNGKGSTGAVLSSVLKHHHCRTGLYTSPHLVRFTERFRINDEEVSAKRIMEIFHEIRQVLDDREPPTFFEVVTAMGLLYFAYEEVDWAVVEVGMGGRLDATNVIQPAVSVITNIAMDHQEFLGNTLSSIAREKAGIIKDNIPIVSGARQPAVLGILKTTCTRHHAPLFRLGTDFRIRRKSNGSFHYHGLRHRWSSLKTNLRGNHQVVNASLALAVLEILEEQGLLNLDIEAVQEGLKKVRWPARLEVLQRNPLIVLDGAHNPQGAASLRDALRSRFSYENLHLVLGIMGDKDIRGMLRRLLPLAKTAIFTHPRYERAADPDLLRRWARPHIQRFYVIPDPKSAIEQAKLLASPEDLICIAGSLYFAGEVKEIFGEPSILEKDE